ncbi:hypothetical protein DFH07DRAFT_845209 [Mycena maculata]|uniref:CCHC-type domain-containing protein n=1 Tax=Mycena maculata TaxID=230809 RepID=A0AAD7I305_9AGAR|nr:hypothetical protein DFH07DRAFT_845209 [Mycena maculata]
MLSLVRLTLRVPYVLRSLRPTSCDVGVGHILRAQAFSSTPKSRRASLPRYWMVCENCRTEGHWTKDCKEPLVCAACGVEGHLRKDCPNPEPARLEALKNAPVKCFRCGEVGHALSKCPQPAKCFNCGQTVRRSTPSLSRVPLPTPVPGL